ncbi:MAG: alpha/beta fold hydrolase [Candidatus Micrarchaeota archaeon]
MGEEITFEGPDGEPLSGYIEEPAEPTGKGVVLLHCFLCTKHHRIMRNLASSLTQHGFTTLRFDFAGNGKSGGKLEETTYTRMIGEVKEAVSFLEKRGIKHIGVAGHSLGAMIGLLSAYEDPRIRAVAFIAGSSQAARVKQVFPPEVLEKAEREGSAHASAFGRDIIIKREFLRDIDRYDVRKSASGLGKPLFIIHGTADEVIDHSHAKQLMLWAGGDKTLLQIDGADHLLKDDGHLSQAMDGACSWFSKVL